MAHPHQPTQALTLVAHHLCPYVQRAVIALEEKQAAYTRIDIDLANKPGWFKALSPLGRVPVLRVGETLLLRPKERKNKGIEPGFDSIKTEKALGDGPYFCGGDFSLVDAAFAPLFRNFDVFDAIGDFRFMRSTPKLSAWRQRLAQRISVKKAAPRDYPARLRAFLARRQIHLATLM
ncbi:MAG: glutathione S-transferase family protein [Alphaproteobacteria bacterium]